MTSDACTRHRAGNVLPISGILISKLRSNVINKQMLTGARGRGGDGCYHGNICSFMYC